MSDQTPSLPVALLAGSLTGTVVDASLHPIDTIKTRLQSPQGLWRSGGFRGSFSGILPVLLVTAPNSAIFFGTYETSKALGNAYLPARYEPLVMVSGATSGEMLSLLIRVPAEVVKQRAQASRKPSRTILKSVLQQDGFRGLYRGFASNVLRDAPYAFVQYPLWDLCKRVWSAHQGYPVTVWQSGICGAIAGGVAAVVTTPCDVVKTRIMLGGQGKPGHVDRIPDVFRTILKERGVRGLFAGVVPRFIWISVGGAYYLGLYEKCKIEIMQYTCT